MSNILSKKTSSHTPEGGAPVSEEYKKSTTTIDKTRIPRGVWLLSIASMLITLSSCIMTTLAPIYLMEVLKVSKSELGLLEGTVEFVSFFLRFAAGYISDFFTNRKMFIALGFSFSTLAKIFIAFAASYKMLFFGKVFDRIGNGIQGAPRDAMLGDFSHKGHTAKAYGLAQSLRKFGSVIGSAFVVLMLMGVVNDFITDTLGIHMDQARLYKLIFLAAVVPSVLGLTFLVLFVPNPKHKLAGTITKITSGNFLTPVGSYLKNVATLGRAFWNTFALFILIMTLLKGGELTQFTRVALGLTSIIIAIAANKPYIKKAYNLMGRAFWLVILLSAVYGISHFNESFLQVIGKDIGMHRAEIAFIVTILCLATATTAYPLGLMADKFGKKKMLAVGFIFMLIADIILAKVHNRVGIYAATWFWGMHWSVTQGILLALLKDVAPKARLGTGFGIFYLTLGISHLGANIIGGTVWETYGAINTFLGAEKMFSLGALLCIVNLIILFITAKLKLFKKEDEVLHPDH